MKIILTSCFCIICFLCSSQTPEPLPFCQGTQKYKVIYSYETLLCGVQNLKGDTILPSIYKEVRIESIFQDSCHEQLTRAIVKTDTSTFCIDLISKKRSASYRKMYFYSGMLIAVDSLNWFLLDHEMSRTGMAYWGEPTFFSPNYFAFTNEDPFIIEESYIKEFHLKTNFNHKIISNAILKKDAYDYQYGLVNVENASIIPADYIGFLGLISENELYYWGLKVTKQFHDPKSNRTIILGGFDVFSSDFRKMASYDSEPPIRFITDKAVYQTSYKAWLDQLVIFHSSSGKVGAVNSKGELIIPFKYDSIQPYEMSLDIAPHYRVWNNEKIRLINDQGRPVIKGEFQEINFNYDPLNFIVRTDTTKNSLSLLDNKSKAIIENCNQIYFNTNSDITSFSPKANITSFDLRFYHIIKNNTFYVYHDEKLLKFDSTNFNFKYPLTLVSSNYLIDSDGEIRIKGLNIYLRHNKYFGGDNQNSKMPFILSLDGKKEMEFPNCKRIGFGPDFVKVEFLNGDIKKFYIDKWDWE